jgi:hypothetical protein
MSSIKQAVNYCSSIVNSEKLRNLGSFAAVFSKTIQMYAVESAD